MAEIDKSLPNIGPNAIPDEAIIETEKKAEVINTPTGPVEIAMDETGGAEVSFDPNAVNIDPTQDHFANLAETLDDGVLDPLGHFLFCPIYLYPHPFFAFDPQYFCFLSILNY